MVLEQQPLDRKDFILEVAKPVKEKKKENKDELPFG
jgi:hypothetical protein